MHRQQEMAIRTDDMWGGLARSIATTSVAVLLLLMQATEVAAQQPPSFDPVSPNDRKGLPVDNANTEHEGNDDNILDLDIEHLGKVNVVIPSLAVEVTSVSRQASTVGKSPAAIFVITPEMIRRSGATSIPEVLRMVPGVNVARISSNKWAVTSRGFNSLYSNKLLVLMDGRRVYTPTFAGVYWDIQDTLLQDIERIEVIRGPGATVWGANAVNGVINIITKKAQDTQGALIAVGGGSEDKVITGARYGGQVGTDLHYRVYGKYFDRDTGFGPIGAVDDWHQGRVGFRTDWNLDACGCDTVTVLGDYYQGASGIGAVIFSPSPPFTVPAAGDAHVSGLDLLARWTHKIDDESSFSLQSYYDRNVRDEPVLHQQVEAFDVEWTHQFSLADRHQIIWGLHYRHVGDQFGLPSPFAVSFDPLRRKADLYDVFAQDKISLVEDALDLTVGCKFEHNDFTGFEYQPTARLLWTIDERRVAWASVSRAVRTPARTDDDFGVVFANIAPFPPTFLALFGNRNVESEDLLAYELGFRAQPTDEFSWDLALFFNDYNDLMSSVPGVVIPPPPALILAQLRANAMTGETYGIELSAHYEMTPWWRLYGAYSFLQMHLHALAAASATSESAEGESPQNQLFVQSSWDLPHQFELDLMGRYVDGLPAFGIGSYISLETRVGWRPTDAWEFSVVGQSLLEGHRREFFGQGVIGSEVDRGVYVQGVWRR